jgi:hypothetical protein
MDLNVCLPVPVVHEVELLVVDGVRAAGPDPDRVQRHIPAASKHTNRWSQSGNGACASEAFRRAGRGTGAHLSS